MKLNADFSARVVIRPADYAWAASPAAGVERMMLDRIGGEVARATTIVRFAPNSAFDAHTHGGGEEYLVLEGVFSDEAGDYPAGTYVRNPIGTSHRPHIGPEGATILVKLHQFEDTDTKQKVVDTRNAAFTPGATEGVEVLPLHSVPTEEVGLHRWQPGTALPPHGHAGGAEIFVLEGSFADEHGTYPAGTWLRLPHLFAHAPRTDEGCLLWVKSGHLPREAAAA
ncbi:cupin domain-containing protein [Roseibacterium sp. SDUM158016]|jgi:anti-sigma factor ChrR (cupin superfamily)|uniref:cupin domain-containing protein n=1 Tax=Roseicyclus sediminis TaxID=2980997 RepID=UPI0021D23350|nr:cupin domain-containing protein [Roseibacterium sp. SDUM158016]MCU4652423.1 cupin domain-containing protein [Roseibacterium sp. SDUM158016]